MNDDNMTKCYSISRPWLPDNRNRNHANRAGSCVRMWSKDKDKEIKLD
jgi:hypothetical protein